MIEINLLPGATKKGRRGGGGGGGGMSMTSVDFGASIGSVRDRIREPWLIGGIVAVRARRRARSASCTSAGGAAKPPLEEALQKAVQDSTRYRVGPHGARSAPRRKRDTVLRSLNLIRAIDDDRFIWPHVMDEVSRALPPVHLARVARLHAAPARRSRPSRPLAPPPPTPTSRQDEAQAAQTAIVPRDTVRVRLVGNTVDIQALTRFMRQLESSPFFEQVQLAKSERANDNGKEVTQFQLDMLYSRPEPSQVRRVPLAVSVR